MLSSGMILKDRYEILDDIGSGGMARVYKVMDHSLNRTAAMKVLRDELQYDEGYLRKFRREAQAAAGLRHDNIVNVYDVDQDQGHWYIVMELVEGVTLKRYIQRKGRLETKECLNIAMQAADGLAAAHQAGIVHRDIKPENMILTLQGNLKISDFGIARVQSGDTMTVDVCGSVYYSSPEQVRGGYSDNRTDIYSLGVVMYEMCTGILPFDGDSVVDIAMQHMNGRIAEPQDIIPQIPDRLNQIILKCLSRRMDDRYQSMKELLQDLMLCMQNPEGSILSTGEGARMDGATVVFSKEQVESIRKGASAKAEKTKKKKTVKKETPAKKKKTEKPSSKKKKKKPEKKRKKETSEVYDDIDDDDSAEISSGLQKALNIGLLIVVVIIGLCVVEFILTSLGVFRELTGYMPSLEKLLDLLNEIRKNLASDQMKQAVQHGLEGILNLIPGLGK